MAVAEQQDTLDHEIIVIGAGVSGIYQLYRLLEMGADVQVLEAGAAPGGTWFWNRYPGARFDSESWTYGYSFSKELLQEWSWSEHFAGQPETLSYLNHVVDRFDMRRHMRFDAKVRTARFEEDGRLWRLEMEGGEQLTCRFLVTAIGMLSAPVLPRIEGVENFEGTAFHTYHWPAEKVELEGKRVGVLGTGATAVQLIPLVAEVADSLTVFQRRPNWCAPLLNARITDEEQARIKATYDEIFARCRETPGGFVHAPDRRRFDEVPEDVRLAFWEELYATPGFAVWVGNFVDVLVDARANAEYTAFIADKIRGRVNDPDLAEKLIPKDHGFGTRRVPLETNYYEAYNRDNVHLVDLNETPIQRVTTKGIRTSAQEHEFDVIIWATGFDAITGAFDRIEFTSSEGRTLREKWNDGPVTYLGLAASGFPNLLTISGPQSGSVATNFPRGIEEAVDWASALIRHLRSHGHTRIEATAEAEQAWLDHVKETYGWSLLPTAKSWFTGYNANIDGHDRLRHLIYNGGAPRYRKRLNAVADQGYEGFAMD